MGSILLGTQYHHTACWQPSWQGLSSWQQMGNQQQWQHSTCHLGSSTIQHMGSIFSTTAFLATNGQSAAVAAQYMPSGQQYHPTYGQHPPGHSVPSHCLLAAILARAVFLATNGQSAAVAAQYMPSGQQYHP